MYVLSICVKSRRIKLVLNLHYQLRLIVLLFGSQERSLSGMPDYEVNIIVKFR